MKTRSFAQFILSVTVLLSLKGQASAHAFVDHAEPKVGSENASTPTEVKIWYSQAVEAAFSKIKVMDSSGKEVDKNNTHQDETDKHLLMVSLPALAPGSYRVVWKVVSVDTHHTQGDFKFSIK